MTDLIPFLLELSAAGRAVTLGAAVPTADNKDEDGGFDPVTHLDRAAEQALRDLIVAHHPEDGIEGEEFGITRADARRRWVLDPIDGTRALICGLPSWTTLVALADDGEPVAGFIDSPALDELVIGLPDGTRIGERRLATSGCARLSEARLATTDPYLFSASELEGFTRLRQAARLTRYGLDAQAYARLAAGHIDLVAESGLKRHDWNALVPVVRGAGGVVGNWRGGDDLSDGDIVAAATPELYAAAVELLGGGLRAAAMTVE